jgi:DhnA family fructose-bisphosphate aldolase class Ia
MKINGPVAKILSHYESDNPGTKANLARMLMHGKLGGTGKMVSLPVDQGNEHGPARSFAPNPRRRRQRLDHRPQHFPTTQGRRARYAQPDHQDL